MGGHMSCYGWAMGGHGSMLMVMVWVTSGYRLGKKCWALLQADLLADQNRGLFAGIPRRLSLHNPPDCSLVQQAQFHLGSSQSATCAIFLAQSRPPSLFCSAQPAHHDSSHFLRPRLPRATPSAPDYLTYQLKNQMAA